jgi:hypothetical protein
MFEVSNSFSFPVYFFANKHRNFDNGCEYDGKYNRRNDGTESKEDYSKIR